jgi:Tol biopolymer transport system component
MTNRVLGTLGLLIAIILVAGNGQFPEVQMGSEPPVVSADQGAPLSSELIGSTPSNTAANSQAPQTGTADSAPAVSLVAVTQPDKAPATGTPTLDELRGKIIFFSDRGSPYAQLYRMNADGSNQRPCNCQSLFADIFFGETASPNRNQFLYVKNADNSQPNNVDSQIWMHDSISRRDTLVTGAGPSFPGVDYDAVWSPDGKQVAWVTEAHTFAEIYRYDFASGSSMMLTESHGEWNKHPSFSPDGARIDFWRNAANADVRQIWVMNADGTHALNLSRNSYRDWDPIWVK